MMLFFSLKKLKPFSMAHRARHNHRPACLSSLSFLPLSSILWLCWTCCHFPAKLHLLFMSLYICVLLPLPFIPLSPVPPSLLGQIVLISLSSAQVSLPESSNTIFPNYLYLTSHLPPINMWVKQHKQKNCGLLLCLQWYQNILIVLIFPWLFFSVLCLPFNLSLYYRVLTSPHFSPCMLSLGNLYQSYGFNSCLSTDIA